METRVSVELHLDEQGNHCSERSLARESGGPRPAAAPPSQPPEQRKGAEGPLSPKLGAGKSLVLGEAGPGTGFGGGVRGARGWRPAGQGGDPRRGGVAESSALHDNPSPSPLHPAEAARS